MVYKMVCREQKSVTPSNNNQQLSTLQFAQDLARRKSEDSFFVGDLGKLETLVEQWFQQLPRVRPFYAVNCNSSEMLLRLMATYPQVGFHCSSRQQLDIALDFAAPDRLFYANTCWTRNNILSAQSNSVALVGFENESELSRFAKQGLTNKLILNINMDAASDLPTGCDVNKAPELLQLAADFGLDCVGLGFNVCHHRPGLFDSLIECAAQLFSIGRSLGLNMKVLNLGGGFPSSSAQQIPSFEQICEQLNSSLDFYFPMVDDVEVIATPGRYFAASIFSLATRIVDKTEVDASQITNDDFDAGQKAFQYKINEGYYGAFNCITANKHEPKCLQLFPYVDYRPEYPCSVLGPTNDEFDVVQKQCQFPQLEVGEWLLWSNMGAYSTNNCESLDDDEPCMTPEIYYYSQENDWKYAAVESTDLVMTSPFGADELGEQSDGESVVSEDSAIELDVDPLWMFDWPIV